MYCFFLLCLCKNAYILFLLSCLYSVDPKSVNKPVNADITVAVLSSYVFIVHVREIFQPSLKPIYCSIGLSISLWLCQQIGRLASLSDFWFIYCPVYRPYRSVGLSISLSLGCCGLHLLKKTEQRYSSCPRHWHHCGHACESLQTPGRASC